MYNSELAKTVSTGGKHLSAGINENIMITNVRVDKTPNNNVAFIEFTFENDKGQTLLATVFEPDRSWSKDETDYKNLVARTVKRLLEIAQCYHKQEVEINEKTFTGFCEGIKDAIKNATLKNNLLRIMVTYNNNGYLQLRRTASYTNVERMDVEKSNIFKLSNDQLEWKSMADKEDEKASGFTSFFKPGVNDQPLDAADTLPF